MVLHAPATPLVARHLYLQQHEMSLQHPGSSTDLTNATATEPRRRNHII